jgi:hypothetical protein
MSLLGLRVDGIDFRTTDGKLFKVVEVSDFALFKRWMAPHGPTHLVAPRLAEWRTIADEGGYHGPITLRVFRYARASNLFGFDPRSVPLATYKAGLRDFLQFCGEHGFYVELTGGDAQYFWPLTPGNRDEADPHALQQQTNEECQAIVDQPNVLWEQQNERMINGHAYGVVPPAWGAIHPLIRSTGYYADHIEDWPADRRLDYVQYHGNRDVGGMQRWPKTIFDMPVQAAFLNELYQVPAILNEPWRYDNSSDAEWAARSGLVIAYCGGVCFHSQRGRDGDGFDQSSGHQRACAVRYFQGIAGGLLAAGLITKGTE